MNPGYALIATLAQKPDKTMDETAIVNRYIQALWHSLQASIELRKWLMEYNPKHLSGASLRNWAEEIAWSILPDGHDNVTLDLSIQDLRNAAETGEQ